MQVQDHGCLPAFRGFVFSTVPMVPSVSFDPRSRGSVLHAPAGSALAYPPLQWVYNYSPEIINTCYCGSLAVDATGTIAITGAHANRIWTLKLSAAGERLWEWRTDTILIVDLPDGRKRAVATGTETFMRLKATMNP